MVGLLIESIPALINQLLIESIPALINQLLIESIPALINQLLNWLILYMPGGREREFVQLHSVSKILKLMNAMCN